MNKKQVLLEKFRKDHRHHPYRRDFPEIDLYNFYIGSAVLRPDKSWVALELAKFLYAHSELYKEKDVLDIGAGSGIQGIICAKNGAKRVVLADLSDSAIQCSFQNVVDYDLGGKVSVVQSDLFDQVKNRFDLIIFNYPFFEESPKNELERIVYSGPDLLKRFFRDLEDHSEENSLLIMPYSHFVGLSGKNSPKKFFKKLNWRYKDYRISNELGNHSIYIAEVKT